MERKYKIIRNKEEVKKVMEWCKESGYGCVEFERNGEGIYKKCFKGSIV